MLEENREIITKEKILAKFKRNHKSRFILGSVVLTVCAVVFCIGLWIIIKELTQTDADKSIIAIVIGFVMLGVMGYGCYRVVYRFIIMAKDLRNKPYEEIIISHAAFDKQVCFDGPRTLLSNGYDAIYFQDGKKFFVDRDSDGFAVYPKELYEALKHTQPGDLYIVVCKANKPEEVVDLYCEKFYVYKE